MATIKVTGLTEHFTLEEYAKEQTGTIPLTAEAILHATMMEEFRQWLGRKMDVNIWYRTPEYNAKKSKTSTSSHLRGVATDWHTTVKIDKDRFIKYAKKWREICKSHGVVGEAGLYEWGVHFGSSVKYSKTFYHWDSRSGSQKNMAFKELK